MLTTTQGVYNDNTIFLDDDIHLSEGQRIILTILDTENKKTSDKKQNYKVNIKQNETEDEAWKCFMDGINGFSDDFMPNGREEFIPSRRETI